MARYLPHESVPPYGLSEELEKRVHTLGMQSNLTDMEKDGYTVLRDVAPPEVTERIREAILRLVHETEGPQKGYTAALLLGRDPAFEPAVLNPKLMALVEYMCGQGALLSQLIGSVRPQGRGFLGIHADQNWIPAPFPEHNQLLTACWVCDDFSEAAGSTKVIPGSHRHRRHPSAEEAGAAEGAMPIVCPKGSIAVWDGSVWHGNYPRALPGERVVLHITYSRLAMRPLECYDHLPEEFLERNPREMATLLGRNDVFGSTTATSGGVVRGLFNRATAQAKNHYVPRAARAPEAKDA